MENNLEFVNCNLCENDNTQLICKSRSKYSPEWFNIVRCKQCQLVYVNPRMNHQVSNQGYIVDTNAVRYFQNIYQNRKDKARMIFSEIFKEYKGPKNTFLDVGAGTGAMLEVALEKGFTKTDGFEMNIASSIEAKKINPNFNISSIDICNQQQINEIHQKFDVIICHHTLEHVYDPLQAIINMKDLLEKNGILFIAVPNINIARKTFLVAGKDPKGILDPSAHVYNFNLMTLEYLTKKAGLTTIKKKSYNSIKKYHVQAPELFSTSIYIMVKKND